MKNLILTISFMVSFVSLAQHQINWNQINLPQLNNHWYKLAFFNNDSGYAISPFHIYSTTDGGINWVLKRSLDTSNNLNEGYFGNIFRFKDSIVIFNRIEQKDSSALFSIHKNDTVFERTVYYDTSHLSHEKYAVACRDSLWYIKSGQALEVSKYDFKRTIRNGSFTGLGGVTVWKNKYLAANMTTHILYSNDSGKTWLQSKNQNHFDLSDGGMALNLGGDTLIYHLPGYISQEFITYDGGLNVINRYPLNRPNVILPFRQNKHLIAANFQKEILFSRDLGFTYQITDTLNHDIKDFYQLNDTTFFAICSNGIVYKSTNMGSIVSTKEKYVSYNTVDIYPNPVQDILNITLINNVKNIRILNQNGKVEMRVNNPKRQVNLEHLKSGVYILEINSGTKTKHLKFVKE